MKTVEYWRWRHRNPDTGQICRTMSGCSVEEATKLYSGAERIEGTMVLRSGASLPVSHIKATHSSLTANANPDVTKPVRRPPHVGFGTVEEVAAGLRRYAGRAEAAVRPVELARRLGLGRRIVQLALESLVAAPASGVRSRQRAGEVWEKYWASAQT